MSGLRKLAGQTAIYGVSSILGRVLNYLLFPLYTRVFSQGEYGVVTELYAYVAFLIVILTYGMETAFFRFASAEKDVDYRNKVFSTSFISIAITAILFALLVLFWSDSVALALQYEANPEYIVWFALIVGLDVLSTIPLARLRMLNKAYEFVGVNLGHILLNIGLNLFFLEYCPAAIADTSLPGSGLISKYYQPEIGIGYIFISNLISSGLKFGLLIPALKQLRFGFDISIYKKLVPYAMPLLLLGLAGIINETFDRAFFTELSGLPEDEARAQLGIYGGCYKVAMLLSIGIQAYRFAAEPFIFAMGGQHADSKSTHAAIMKYYFIIALWITLTLLCFEDIVILMVGPEFREGRGVIPILLWAYICFGAVFNLSFWYKLNNKTLYGALIAITGAAATILFNILLVPTMGYHGAAWATLISYFFMMLVSYLLGQRHYPVPYPLREIALYLALALVLWAAFIWVAPVGVFRYTMAGLAVLLYMSVAYFREKPKATK